MVKIVKELETGKGRLAKAIALACLLEDNVIFVTDKVTKEKLKKDLLKVQIKITLHIHILLIKIIWLKKLLLM